MSSASRRLSWKIAASGGGLETVGRALWHHPRFAELFPEFLCRSYPIARAGVPLMEQALGQLEPLRSGDPLASQLATYLRRHIPEERGHDEWLLQDLEALGWPREEAVGRLPTPGVAALVGAQQYWIRHHHPVAIVGFLVVLESNVPSVEQVEDAISRSGLPRRGFRNYIRHARLDVRHRRELHELVDRLPMSDRHTAIVGLSAMGAVQGLERFLQETLEVFESRSRRTAGSAGGAA